MSLPPLNVLYEDNHLLAVDKPATLPTMGVAEDRPSLLKLAKSYIGEKYNKPGNVYLGTVSRLDTPVSGVVLFARTSKAAARLSQQFRDREVEKTYWAVVDRPADPPSGELEHHLVKDQRHRSVRVYDAARENSQLARLHYRSLGRAGPGQLLEIELETGRKHQIRAQLAAVCRPIWGDRKYGSRKAFPAGIALHARRLVVRHPTRGEAVTLTADPPAAWKMFGDVRRLAG